MAETDLYKPVKEFFEDLGYKIYAEVEVPKCGGRVDVVAYCDPTPVAIELKANLSFSLIEQAVLRKNVFPLVYIAYPVRKKPMELWLRNHLRELGIGILEVSGKTVRVVEWARWRKPLMRRVKNRIDFKTLLKPEHQEWVEGGTNRGGYVTDYALTMKGVRHFLYKQRVDEERINDIMKKIPAYEQEEAGWRSVAEILDHCETHYGTPKKSLGKALMEIEGKWCETKKEGGRLYFRHKA